MRTLAVLCGAFLGLACAGKRAPVVATTNDIMVPRENFEIQFERFWWVGPASRVDANDPYVHTHNLGFWNDAKAGVLLFPNNAVPDPAQVSVVYSIAVYGKGVFVPASTGSASQNELLLERLTDGSGYRSKYAVYLGLRFDARTMKIPDEPPEESVDERRMGASQMVFTYVSGEAPKPDRFYIREFEPEVTSLVQFLDWYERNGHPPPKEKKEERSAPAVASR